MNLTQVREKERKKNLRRKITCTLKALKDEIERNGSRTFIRMQSEELGAMGKTCKEVNDDLCDNYHDDLQADLHMKKQLIYSRDIAVLLDESAKHLALREDEPTTICSGETNTPREQTTTLEEANGEEEKGRERRRDLLRRAHKREIEKVGLKISANLEELDKLIEPIESGIIDDVCAKIPQEEQDAWKRPLQGREEYRTLKEFAHGLFERALAKPTVETLLEERYEKNLSEPESRQGRTGVANRGPPFGEQRTMHCYRCGEDHKRVACLTFR